MSGVFSCYRQRYGHCGFAGPALLRYDSDYFHGVLLVELYTGILVELYTGIHADMAFGPFRIPGLVYITKVHPEKPDTIDTR